jgi:hypothetical protein
MSPRLRRNETQMTRRRGRGERGSAELELRLGIGSVNRSLYVW